ncbi:lipopolysaccharide biosynthesis protein [Halomonas denitrificans]|uniref:lipopolysaccharide biosynthesis protein n=1 Tax=Halomonas denitrificans TaxID=370769 RepID=UPI001C9A1905|nr:lipopolysaccharide biosynthesis protein [Halomonas denitrificans]MBY5969554.1 lipopolysaccharide biosynthesis protein [Halomonas denitrificans]
MTNTPTQPPEHYFPRPPADDEISLVDIALILVRRWKMMAVIFLVVVLAALAFALSKTDTYRYVSIYNVAERQPSGSSGVGVLEAPKSVVSKIENYYFDAISADILEAKGLARFSFETQAEAPDNVAFLTISSEADEDSAALVKEYHQTLLDTVKQDQDQLLAKRKNTLEQQLQSAEESLEAAKQSTSESAAELVATYTANIVDIEQDLAYLAEGHVQRVAAQSRVPVGTSKALIMALAIVLGSMLAVMAAFIAEFAGTVRKASQQRG